MAEAIKGVNRVILMRPISLQDKADAGRLAFQTEHEKTSSRESDAVPTKDGSIISLAEETVELSLTTIMAQEDETREKIEDAYHNGEIVEFWDINKTKANGTDKFPATYYQGYITEWTESATSEDNVEFSLSATMNGGGVKGEATLSDDQAAVVQYEFADTTPEN